MKIAFMVATRGVPKRAAAVIEGARSLESSKHEVVYVVGCDADDVATQEYFRAQYPDVLLTVDERPPGVGAVWNRCAALVPADVYVPFVDDGFVATPHWDEIIELVLSAYPTRDVGVFAWHDLANPGQCSLPIITKEWLGLCGLYDDRFPFWFYDSCVAEVWSFVTGKTVPIIPNLVLAQNKGITRRMRDLAMWWELFIATRRERLETAARIRARLGIEIDPIALSRVIMAWRARDIEGQSTIAETERNLAEVAAPTPEYLKARAAAQAYLRDNEFVGIEAEIVRLSA